MYTKEIQRLWVDIFRRLRHNEKSASYQVWKGGEGVAADDRDRHFLDAECAVKAVNRADQACRVAGGQLQVVLADADQV